MSDFGLMGRSTRALVSKVTCAPANCLPSDEQRPEPMVCRLQLWAGHVEIRPAECLFCVAECQPSLALHVRLHSHSAMLRPCRGIGSLTCANHGTCRNAGGCN